MTANFVNLAGLTLGALLMKAITMVIAIPGHELAHGYVAYLLGDPTAKRMGRLTMNPVKHIDPMGAICMVLFGFGWAKAVPVNPMYFKNRKAGMAITALAGPLANILMAIIATVILVPVIYLLPDAPFVLDFLCYFVQMNFALAVFNLIPFPPLDGSKILGTILPASSYDMLLQYERYGMIILLVLSYTGVIGRIFDAVLTPMFNAWVGFADAYGMLFVR